MTKLHALIQNYYGGDEGLNEILKEALLLSKKCDNLETALDLVCHHLGEVHGECEQENPDYWIQKGIDIEKAWIDSGKVA